MDEHAARPVPARPRPSKTMEPRNLMGNPLVLGFLFAAPAAFHDAIGAAFIKKAKYGEVQNTGNSLEETRG